MLSHSTQSCPWQLILSDLFELDGQRYVLVADNFSKMSFVKHLGQNTASRTVISFLEELFSIHGPCQISYSDNSPQYFYAEFKRFAEEWDIVHVTSSPRYAQSKGSHTLNDCQSRFRPSSDRKQNRGHPHTVPIIACNHQFHRRLHCEQIIMTSREELYLLALGAAAAAYIADIECKPKRKRGKWVKQWITKRNELSHDTLLNELKLEP